MFLLCAMLVPASAFALEPDDALYDDQWYLEQISAPDAWDKQTGEDVVVAILDSGVDLDHPDLKNRIWVNAGEIADNGIDDDGNGYIDDVNGWDFIDGDADPNPDASTNADPSAVSHGTLIAGLVGAQADNDDGIAGVMWDAQIMPVRMLDKEGSGTTDTATFAIEYAIENGADVINLSFAGTVATNQLRNAVREAHEQGVVVVAALGNEGKNTDQNQIFPACFRGEEDWVIGVGSTNQRDLRSTFSNYGKLCTDVFAPGEQILSTDYYDEDDDDFDEAYSDGWSGTSMASPLVAGAAGLLLSEYPTLTPTQVRNAIKLSVDAVAAGGAGRLNIAQALDFAANYAESTEEPEEETEETTTEEGETGVSPVTGEEEAITAVAAGDYITSPSFATVYYVTEDGTRRPFMDTQTFFTHADSFSLVKEVTDATLPTLALEGLMLPKEEVVLVKITSSPAVYALEENLDDPFAPILREIPSEEVAQELYGSAWADYVIDVSSTFFSRFATGEPMTDEEDVNRTIMKTRAQLAALAQ